MAGLNAVIDISHHNGTHLDFDRAQDAGIIGVIHKATQGQANVDPNYAANRAAAVAQDCSGAPIILPPAATG